MVVQPGQQIPYWPWPGGRSTLSLGCERWGPLFAFKEVPLAEQRLGFQGTNVT